MRKLWYIPLEPYANRYTLQLMDWNIAEFKRLKVNYSVVLGDKINHSDSINTGEVLDAYGRPYWAMSQIMNLVKALQLGEIEEDDWILLEDMFHPGIESLAYIFNLQGWRPRIAVRCLAQTIDPDDFAYRTGMAGWMRKYERMVNEFVDCVLMFSFEMVSYATASGWKIPIYVTGQPFNSKEVRSRVKEIPSFENRNKIVSFASRLAPEKQLDFLTAVIEETIEQDPTIQFKIISAGMATKGYWAYHNLDKISEANLKIYSNPSKQEYYHHLANSRVLFNCSLQDWISYVVTEADCLGCNIVVPAYRSFPEATENNEDQMFIPWSVKDAADKIIRACNNPSPHIGEYSARQDKSISCTLACLRDFETATELLGNYIDPQTNFYRTNIEKEAIRANSKDLDHV